MPNITFKLGSWYDIIICKWKLDGTDYNDTKDSAETACKTVGFQEQGLFKPKWLSNITAISNQTFYQYLNDSNCEK